MVIEPGLLSLEQLQAIHNTAEPMSVIGRAHV